MPHMLQSPAKECPGLPAPALTSSSYITEGIMRDRIEEGILEGAMLPC